MKKIIVIVFMLLGVKSLQAQISNPVKWSYAAKKGDKGTATLYIKAVVESPWHIYSVNQKPGGPAKTEFTFTPSKDYTLVGKVTEPKPIVKYEDSFGINVYYFNNEVVFQQKVNLKAKSTTVKGKVSFMACNDQSCLPPDEVEFSIPVQ